MSLFVTYHIAFTIVLFCKASIMHSTPSLSILFSDNLEHGAETEGVILSVFSPRVQIFSTTHQSSSSDTLCLIRLARAQAPALPILLLTKLL